jgi:hypothetical protein
VTILYSLWEKKSETTKEEIQREMAMPLDILDEIGQSYSPTRKLHHALATLVAATIENLERSRSGANGQSVSFTSPPRPSMPQPMQLPLRIDAGLEFNLPRSESQLHMPVRLPSNSVPPVPVQVVDNTSAASLRWQDSNGQALVQPDNNSGPLVESSNKQAVSSEPGGFSPSEAFDESILWGASLEWNGGWDDFLNAIAM